MTYVANPTPAPWSAPGQQATDVPKVALRWGRGGAGRKGTRPWQKIIGGDSARTYFAFWQGVSSCSLSFQFVSKDAKYHASMKPCTFLLAGSEWKFKVEKEEERKGNKARRKKERKTEIYFILETDGHFRQNNYYYWQFEQIKCINKRRINFWQILLNSAHTLQQSVNRWHNTPCARQK